MRDVKVFMADRSANTKLSVNLKEKLLKHDIPIYHENIHCDTAVILKGDFINPLAFQGKKVLAVYLIDGAGATTWDTLFPILYKPILHHYYNEIVDVGGYDTVAEMADKIAEEVKRLEHETD